jgi:hypothetical protein
MTHPKHINQFVNLGLENSDTSETLDPLLTFTLKNEIIEYSTFTTAIREIARLHIRGVTSNVDGGLLLVAQSGGGKSTVLEYYERRFPRITTSCGTQIPVLRVDTPESPTIKSFTEAILSALKDPGAHKGNAAEKTNRIVHLLKNCVVELLFIDEFQHFFDGRWSAESERVSNWLKNLINKVRIPVVLTGLPCAISVVNSNRQLRRRFAAAHYMKPFGFDSESEKREFRAVLKGIQLSLPIKCMDLSEANTAKRFYYATHGLIDYVVKIIDDAVSRRSSAQKEPLALQDFADAFKRQLWLDAPNELNPFIEKATLRLLNKPLEPFDKWDDISKYTSPKKQKGVNK